MLINYNIDYSKHGFYFKRVYAQYKSIHFSQSTINERILYHYIHILFLDNRNCIFSQL